MTRIYVVSVIVYLDLKMKCVITRDTFTHEGSLIVSKRNGKKERGNYFVTL